MSKTREESGRKEVEWQRLHDQAVAAEQEFYLDPDSKRMVFTSLHHLRRGACCESGCRHCPYRATGQAAPERK